MAIIFENITTGETVGIDPQTEGKFYGAKLSAMINSSNMSVNADRGQDYGWRLEPEQQALIESWEEDGMMIDTVSKHTNVPVDDLTHADFLQYLVYQQNLGTSPERKEIAIRREREAEYQARVAALRSAPVAEPMAPFVAPTVEDFLNGNLTGDASGDKVEEAELPASEKAELDTLIAEGEAQVAPAKKSAKK